MAVNDIILKIEGRLPRLAYRGLKIHQNFEKIYCILLNMLIKTISHDRVENSQIEEFVD